MMLKKVHELRDSIDDDQWDIIDKRLSPEMATALRGAFDATTQEDVERHVGVFTKLMTTSPMSREDSETSRCRRSAAPTEDRSGAARPAEAGLAVVPPSSLGDGSLGD